MRMNENKAIKAGAGYVLGNYFLKGISFITIPIFSRLMAASEYGLFNTFIAYEAILYIFMGLALHSSFKNAKYKFTGFDEHRYNTFVSSSIMIIIISIVIWFFITFMFRDSLSSLLHIDNIGLILLVLYSGGSAILACFNSYVALDYKYHSFLKISFANALCNIVISLILMLTVLKEDKYLARTLGTTIPIIFISIYICLMFFKKEHPKLFSSDMKWGIKYSLPIIPHGISQVILSQFDRIMITTMVSSMASGIYSFAYNIYTILAITANSLDNVWNPWIFEKMHNNEYAIIKKYSSLYAGGMLIISMIVIVISPELILLLGGSKYKESVYCVIPIVASGYFSFLYTIPASVEYYYEKTNYIALGTSFAAIMNVVLNYFFINKYGYVAAAYTTLVTYIVYFDVHYIIAKKIHGVCLFSTIKLIGMCITILIVSGITIVLIERPVIRICFAVLAGLSTAFYTEKKYDLKKKFKKIIDKKK